GWALSEEAIQSPNHELAQRVPQHGDALVTIAQQLEQKGIEKGRAEGIQLGRQVAVKASWKLPVPCCRTALTVAPSLK
ncbi:putative transposase, partial [Candidatus Erwinia dacicola]